MKKILIFAVATAVALSYCSKNEVSETPDSLKSEISFSPYVGTTTKATVTDKNNFTSFTLNAYLDGETSDPFIADNFTGSVDEYDESKEFNSSTNKTYYWPASGTLDFYGYVTASGLGYSAPVYAANKSITTPAKLTYIAPPAMASQVDIVAADVVSKACSTTNTAAVELPFKHLLTQIQFSAKGDANAADDDFDYNLKSITITGVKDRGVYTWQATNPSWAASCSAINTLVDYTYTTTPQTFDAKSDAVPVTVAANAGTLMLIPQELTDVKLVVEYTVTDGSKVTPIADYTGDKKKTIDLTDSSVDEWIAGKSIVYTLELKADAGDTNAITIKASLTDWASITVDKTIQ